MEKMQFKSFLFPYNPSTITVERPGRYAVFFCPGYGETVQPLGEGVRLIRCIGSFLGNTPQEATAILASFLQATQQPTPGILTLPGLANLEAVLSSFTYEASGEGRIIPYEMRFQEAKAGELL